MSNWVQNVCVKCKIERTFRRECTRPICGKCSSGNGERFLKGRMVSKPRAKGYSPGDLTPVQHELQESGGGDKNE